MDDLDATVRTIYGEARGEPIEGKIAVAWVIRNRADHGGWWGATPQDVCHKAFQFSCWNKNDPNSAKLLLLSDEDPAYLAIRKIAQAVLDKTIPDPTHGATHYKVHGTKASWDAAVKDQTPLIIGHHEFFKLDA